MPQPQDASEIEPYALTITDVAELLGVNGDTVRRWADDEQLAHWRTPTGERRFRRSDVLALLPPA